MNKADNLPMTSERIREIQKETAYPESISVHQALLQVWNECQQYHNKQLSNHINVLAEMKYSEKEVLEHLNLLYSMKNSLVDTFTDKNDRITMKWFEQFKK